MASCPTNDASNFDYVAFKLPPTLRRAHSQITASSPLEAVPSSDEVLIANTAALLSRDFLFGDPQHCEPLVSAATTTSSTELQQVNQRLTMANLVVSSRRYRVILIDAEELPAEDDLSYEAITRLRQLVDDRETQTARAHALVEKLTAAAASSQPHQDLQRAAASHALLHAELQDTRINLERALTFRASVTATIQSLELRIADLTSLVDAASAS